MLGNNTEEPDTDGMGKKKNNRLRLSPTSSKTKVEVDLQK